MFLFLCDMCIYVSSYISSFVVFPTHHFSTLFSLCIFGYNLIRCTFSYQTLVFFLFSGPVVFPSCLYLVVYLIVACVACNFTIACLRFDAYFRMSGVHLHYYVQSASLSLVLKSNGQMFVWEVPSL
jgi:ABC-type glycerol-3-phosphate transport system permease component